MRRMTILAAAAAISLWAPAALPCGGAFSSDAGRVVILNEQTIVVAYKQGIETYVFQPHFCGKATEFGLILPVPAPILSSPALADATLYDELAALSAPRHVAETKCYVRDCDGGCRDGGASGDANAGDAGDGTTVVDKGKVGIFDWTFLKADSTAAFTSWLDANGYSHAASADAPFSYYVAGGWYFVAFKVTASTVAPAANEKLCGDFGPIALRFPVQAPVVPTRIAAVSATDSSNLLWHIYAVSDQSLSAPQPPIYHAGYSARMFSGALGPAELAWTPALAKLAAPGDRLVKTDVASDGETDIVLTSVSLPDFRAPVYDITYVSCDDGGTLPVDAGGTLPVDADVDAGDDSILAGGGGCALGGGGSSGATAVALVAFAGMVARRRRRQGTQR